MSEFYNTNNRIKKDLFYLYDLLKEFYESQTQTWDRHDEEFIRIWELYKNVRESLLTIDDSLFGKLREISKPTPIKNTYHPNGIYTRGHFKALINEINLAIDYFDVYQKSIITDSNEIPYKTAVTLLTSKFGKIVRQLRSRYDNRSTIEIEDEYDMQDLFHALLFLFFDDIRPEEWTPSYGGGSSRMDFLLKNEKVAVELKKTRKGLNAKELGKQLIDDIAKYNKHPDVNKLICFVYDPEYRIANPKGIESDLSETREDFEVEVIIEPK